jgi:hypothetical protein
MEEDKPYPVWCCTRCKDALVAKGRIPFEMEEAP